MKNLCRVLIFAFITIYFENTFAQTINSFTKTYDYISGDGTCLVQNSDGGFTIAGQGGSDVMVIRTNPYGDTLWSKRYGGSGGDEAWDIQKTNDGGYIVVGEYNCCTDGDMYVLRLDKDGDTLWTRTYGYGYEDRANSVCVVDSGYIISGYTSNGFASGFGTYNLFFIDTSGGLISSWSQYQGKGGLSIRKTYDNGFIVANSTTTMATITKLDYLLNSLWSSSFDGGMNSSGYTSTAEGAFAVQTIDSGYALIGSMRFPQNLGSGQHPFVVKLNNSGDTLWTNYYSNFESHTVYGQPTPDNGLILTGTSLEAGSQDIYLLKINSFGGEEWHSNFDSGTNGPDEGRMVVNTYDGGFALTGYETPSGGSLIPLIKTKNVSNKTTGRIYADVNQNCIYDSLDFPLSGIPVKMTPGPFYGITNQNGIYTIYPDTGTYTIEQTNHYEVWPLNCSPSILSVHYSTPYDTSANNNFGNLANFQCPKIWVDIASDAARRCRSSKFDVHVCNEGSATAFGPVIKVEINSYLTVTSSSIPWDSTFGNEYYFHYNFINPGQCFDFTVNTSVVCFSPPEASSCITAKVVPDYSCYPGDTAFSTREVEVIGNCISADSLRFVIKNNHLQSITENGIFAIWEDNIRVVLDTFSVQAGDSLIIYHPANGSLVRFMIFFVNFPNTNWFEGPEVTIEGCGSNPVYGNNGQLPIDENHDNYDEVCVPIIYSLDPNDKLVSPTGITSNHYISPNSSLNYTIRFQNTGTDTAFSVVIRDTLSSFLNINSIRSGASSHPYDFNVYSNGIAEWVFQNILLPDSNINEAESHGFVEFSIEQRDSNQFGTSIFNNAAIFFDFNEPVITNRTQNIVCELPVSTFTYNLAGGFFTGINNSLNSSVYLWTFGDGSIDTSISSIHTYQLNGTYQVCLFAANDCELNLSCQTLNVVNVGEFDISTDQKYSIYPNPTHNKFLVKFNNVTDATGFASIYDSYGKLISTIGFSSSFELDLGNHSNGIYHLTIKTMNSIFHKRILKF